MAISVFVLNACGTTGSAPSADRRTEEAIRQIYDLEHANLLRMDIAGQDRLLPADFVVTNPFGMFIGKQEVMERLRANIIKYSRYDREYDCFRRYGDTVIVAGRETVVPTPDARRPDAGRSVFRRFTEVWIHRNGRWEKVARHASNVAGTSDASGRGAGPGRSP